MILENCISSPLWPLFQRFKLTKNLRATPNSDDFSTFLLRVGDGDLPLKQDQPFYDCVEIPQLLVCDDHLIDQIIPLNRMQANPAALCDRAILTPKNEDSLFINDKVLPRLPGQEHIFYSVDSIIGSNDPQVEDNFPLEFVNSLTPSGIPTHKITLKQGAIIMLLRNLNTKQGLTNGTRLIIKRIHSNFVDVEIVTGSSKGRRVFLPKMTLIPSDLKMPITFRRTQFPIRLAYAMTINKSQG